MAAAAACPITSEIDQAARHHADMRQGPINLTWSGHYMDYIKDAFPDSRYSCVGSVAWTTHWANDDWNARDTLTFLTLTCCSHMNLAQYVREIAIPLMPTDRIALLARYMQTLRLDSDAARALFPLLTAELARRRAPVDTRQAFIVSDLARALTRKGLPQELQDMIAAHAIGPTHNLPRMYPRALSLKAVAARLDALIQARPEDHELKRLRQDVHEGRENKRARQTPQ